MRLRFTSFVLLVLISLPLLSIPASANFSVNIYIDDAWYEDIDSDGIEDDIGVNLTVSLYNKYVYTDIDLYLGITLPSGYEYWFLASFTVEKYTYYTDFGMTFELYNTATESGWYDASAVGFADGEMFSYMHTITFDPPGDTNEGNPAGAYYFR
jgi:hypothetical protein